MKENQRPSFWMPRTGDIVDYHSIVGGPISSHGHTVTSVGELPSGSAVAWISGKSGCVSVDALTPHAEATRGELLNELEVAMDTLSNAVRSMQTKILKRGMNDKRKK
jgi:hypothetical protein